MDSTAEATARYLRERQKHHMASPKGLWIGSWEMALTNSRITQMLRRRCKQAGIRRLRPHQRWSASEYLHKH